MIVECPECTSRYRVREEKLPAGGGNIQCPGCGAVFPAQAAKGSENDLVADLPSNTELSMKAATLP
ncbi:MAG: zinc-ribbon domain-containing protein, partial [Myxococcales bacterium]|nr:zinc-ribbon domain-containing protein [Myxococcales bacterium]